MGENPNLYIFTPEHLLILSQWGYQKEQLYFGLSRLLCGGCSHWVSGRRVGGWGGGWGSKANISHYQLSQRHISQLTKTMWPRDVLIHLYEVLSVSYLPLPSPHAVTYSTKWYERCRKPARGQHAIPDNCATQYDHHCESYLGRDNPSTMTSFILPQLSKVPLQVRLCAAE